MESGSNERGCHSAEQAERQDFAKRLAEDLIKSLEKCMELPTAASLALMLSATLAANIGISVEKRTAKRLAEYWATNLAKDLGLSIGERVEAVLAKGYHALGLDKNTIERIKIRFNKSFENSALNMEVYLLSHLAGHAAQWRETGLVINAVARLVVILHEELERILENEAVEEMFPSALLDAVEKVEKREAINCSGSLPLRYEPPIANISKNQPLIIDLEKGSPPATGLTFF